MNFVYKILSFKIFFNSLFALFFRNLALTKKLWYYRKYVISYLKSLLFFTLITDVDFIFYHFLCTYSNYPEESQLYLLRYKILSFRIRKQNCYKYTHLP